MSFQWILIIFGLVFNVFQYVVLYPKNCFRKKCLTHFRPMFHLWINQVVGFFTLPQVFFKHFASKNPLPGFYKSGTLVENGLTTEQKNSKCQYLVYWISEDLPSRVRFSMIFLRGCIFPNEFFSSRLSFANLKWKCIKVKLSLTL